MCGDPLPHATSTPVCRACTQELQPRTDTGCRRCGDWLDPERNFEEIRFRGMLCTACRLVPPAFAGAVAFGHYSGDLRELIHLFKYEGMQGLAAPLGERLAEAILRLEASAGPDLQVVAVPLHRGALRQRGFNQARLLSDQALLALERKRPGWKLVPAHALLVRGRSTDAQFSLSRRDRRRNLAGAFTVPASARNAVQGKNVLLIDDIMTTGATMRECARVLIGAGAAKVWVATLARATEEDDGQDTDGGQDAEDGLAGSVAMWDSESQPDHTHLGEQ